MEMRCILKRWYLVALPGLVLLVLGIVVCWPPRKPYSRRIVPLHPQCRATLTGFQLALRDGDWEKALTFCSAPVNVAAEKYDSPETFFRDVVPVKQIVDLRRFRTQILRFEGARRMNAMAYRWLVPVAMDADGWPTVQWYELTRNQDRWEITFAYEPLDQWLQGVMDRRDATRRQLDEEHRRQRTMREERLARLMPTLTGVRLALKAAKGSFRKGEPILLSLELANAADSPVHYEFGMTSSSLTVVDDRDLIVPPGRRSYEKSGGWTRLEPGQSVVLSQNYDVGSIWAIDQRGRYRIEFNGSGLAVGEPPDSDPNGEAVYADIDVISNMVEIEVRP
jgi:hypothetical protein